MKEYEPDLIVLAGFMKSSVLSSSMLFMEGY